MPSGEVLFVKDLKRGSYFAACKRHKPDGSLPRCRYGLGSTLAHRFQRSASLRTHPKVRGTVNFKRGSNRLKQQTSHVGDITIRAFLTYSHAVIQYVCTINS
jgi:hypothetical protein